MRLWLLMVWRDLKESYPSLFALAGELIAVAISLMIYRYTAAAFSPKLPGPYSDYFRYIVVGELGLFIPSLILVDLPAKTRSLLSDGSLEALWISPYFSHWPLLLVELSTIPRSLVKIFTIITAATLIFGMNLSLSDIVTVLALQLLALPAFAGVGLLASAILLRFGRGVGLTAYFSTAGAILSGSYFPRELLPEWVQRMASSSFPQTLLLDTIRGLLSHDGNTFNQLLHFAQGFVIWNSVLLALGWMAFELAARHLKKRGALYLA